MVSVVPCSLRAVHSRNVGETCVLAAKRHGIAELDQAADLNAGAPGCVARFRTSMCWARRADLLRRRAGERVAGDPSTKPKLDPLHRNAHLPRSDAARSGNQSNAGALSWVVIPGVQIDGRVPCSFDDTCCHDNSCRLDGWRCVGAARQEGAGMVKLGEDPDHQTLRRPRRLPTERDHLRRRRLARDQGILQMARDEEVQTSRPSVSREVSRLHEMS